MRGWWQDLTDLVLPAECGGCGRARTVLCPECRAALSGTVPCRVRPEPEPTGLPAVYAAARYADEVRAVLLAHKERGALTLAAPLGAALAGAVRAGLREAWAGGAAGGCGAVTGVGARPTGAGWGSEGPGWGSEGAERGRRVVGPGCSREGPGVAGGAFGGLTGGGGRESVGPGWAGGVAGWGLAEPVEGRTGDSAVGADWGSEGASVGCGGGLAGAGGRGSLSAAAGRGGGSAGAGAEHGGGLVGVRVGASEGAERGGGLAGAWAGCGGGSAEVGGRGAVGGAAGFAGVAVGPGVKSAGDGSGFVAAAGAGGSGAGGGVVLLVPVPSARRVVGARGHDPARRIALAAAGELRRSGVAARVVGVLRQRRAVADQSGLDSRERLENLAGALEVVPGGGRLLLGGPVVLVDDLMTTGASLTEAARAVRAATAPAAEAVARGREGGSVAYGSAVTAVYGAAAREGTRGRRNRLAEADMGRGPGMVRTYRAGDVICAAVVAAAPGSFEINRN